MKGWGAYSIYGVRNALDRAMIRRECEAATMEEAERRVLARMKKEADEAELARLRSLVPELERRIAALEGRQ